MTDVSPAILNSVFLFALVSLAPLFLVAATSFTKITVVLLVVRNALGIQQTPPNILVYTVAAILTVFVMGPIFQITYSELVYGDITIERPADIGPVIERFVEPYRSFLFKYSDQDSRTFFMEASGKIWQGIDVEAAAETDLSILIPAFLVCELRRAFEIGFLLYLPFLVIDFAVSAVLIGLGMQMLSPPVISTPLKLLLFVAVDGWRKLLEGLILSYA